MRIVTYVVDADPETLGADLPLEVTFRPLAFPTVPDRERRRADVPSRSALG